MAVLKGNKEIGRYIGASVPTLIRHREEWKLPCWKVGRIVIANTEDLDRWKEEQKALMFND